MPSSRAVIHRTRLPIDDLPHGIDLTGEILHVAARHLGTVEVWYQARPDGMDPMRRSFQVVGTGQPIPAHLGFYATHKGSAVTPDGQLVWHVLENHCQHQNVADASEVQDPPGHGRGICVDCSIRLRGDGEDGWLPA